MGAGFRRQRIARADFFFRATNLVLSVGFGELDSLLEDTIFFLELYGLCPVIEGTGNVYFVGGSVFPRGSNVSAWRVRHEESLPDKGVFAHGDDRERM